MRNVATQDLRQEHGTEGSESVLGQKEKEPRKNILGGSEEWRECGGFGNAGKFG